VRSAPNDPEARINVALLFARKGQLSETSRTLETAPRLGPRFTKIRRTVDDLTRRAPP